MLMLSVFVQVYEVLIGANPLNPEYRDNVFASVGLISIIASLVISLIFYIALGRWKPLFYKAVHWIITLSATGFTGFCIAHVLTSKEIGGTDSYAFRFALINAFYTALYFCIFSLLLKRFSIFARHTPF